MRFHLLAAGEGTRATPGDFGMEVDGHARLPQDVYDWAKSRGIITGEEFVGYVSHAPTDIAGVLKRSGWSQEQVDTAIAKVREHAAHVFPDFPLSDNTPDLPPFGAMPPGWNDNKPS